VIRGQDFEHLLRALAPEVLGVLVRRYGRFDACEDAVQEALLTAAVRWPADGAPDNPRAWLLTVASRRLIDELRRDIVRRRREELIVEPEAPRTPAGSEPRHERMTTRWPCCFCAATSLSLRRHRSR
jgi:predicted RNA polymerase sigma factor